MSLEILRKKVRESLIELSSIINGENSDFRQQHIRLIDENTKLKEEVNKLKVDLSSMERRLNEKAIFKPDSDSYNDNSEHEISIAKLRRLLTKNS